MIFGNVPFGEDDEDPIVIYEKILEGSIEFEKSYFKSLNLRSILNQLLNKNPAARTCGGFNFIKKNPWLSGFN